MICVCASIFKTGVTATKIIIPYRHCTKFAVDSIFRCKHIVMISRNQEKHRGKVKEQLLCLNSAIIFTNFMTVEPNLAPGLHRLYIGHYNTVSQELQLLGVGVRKHCTREALLAVEPRPIAATDSHLLFTLHTIKSSKGHTVIQSIL